MGNKSCVFLALCGNIFLRSNQIFRVGYVIRQQRTDEQLKPTFYSNILLTFKRIFTDTDVAGNHMGNVRFLS